MPSYKKTLIFSLAVFLLLAGVVEAKRPNAGEERSFLRRQKKALKKIEESFLKGDYKNSVKVSEDILYLSKRYSAGNRYLDDLYYFAGIAHLKLNNTEKAKYYLNKIISKYKNSKFYPDAYLALAEAYFLGGDYAKSSELFLGYARTYPVNPSTPKAYLRLGEIAQKRGTWEEAKYYFGKVKNDFPLSFEAEFVPAGLNEDMFYFTIQLGSFGNLGNARKLAGKLKKKGYTPYIVEVRSSNSTLYRVRVGKVESRTEARYLADKLKRQGFQVKIYP